MVFFISTSEIHGEGFASCPAQLWRVSESVFVTEAPSLFQIPPVVERRPHHVSDHAGRHRTYLLQLRTAARLPKLRSTVHGNTDAVCHLSP